MNNQMAKLLEPFDPAARELILTGFPRIRMFWAHARDRKSSALTMAEVHQAIEALPTADPDRQSWRGRRASIAYYRNQIAKSSGRKRGAASPQTQLLRMLCRLYFDSHRNGISVTAGHTLHDFVYAGVAIIDPTLAHVTPKAIDRVWERMQLTR